MYLPSWQVATDDSNRQALKFMFLWDAYIVSLEAYIENIHTILLLMLFLNDYICHILLDCAVTRNSPIS